MLVERVGVVQTERLLLLRLQDGDAAAVFAVHGDPATNAYNPNGPHRSPAQSEAVLRVWLADWERDGIGYCLVVPRGNPAEVSGFSGLRVIELGGERVLNLYYRFVPSAWGRGLAAEAARAGLELAGRTLPELPVVALIGVDNLPSQRLARRLGFATDGTVDSENRYIYRLPSAPGPARP
ncbi:GNAT family N-acetyltransferase [Streptacidiphilus sp. 4-A2]|nr:GNAT family N-acetyltransferase [Streptacidiphilus sp. 4-A2]